MYTWLLMFTLGFSVPFHWYILDLLCCLLPDRVWCFGCLSAFAVAMEIASPTLLSSALGLKTSLIYAGDYVPRHSCRAWGVVLFWSVIFTAATAIMQPLRYCDHQPYWLSAFAAISEAVQCWLVSFSFISHGGECPRCLNPPCLCPSHWSHGRSLNFAIKGSS